MPFAWRYSRSMTCHWTPSCWYEAARFPKPPAAKVQRNACRTAFLTGELKALAEHWRARRMRVPISAPPSKAKGSSIAHPAPHSSQISAFDAVCRHARALAGAALPDLTPDTPITALNLDSLQRLELVAALEKTFGGHMPDAAYCQVQTLEELAQAAQKHLIEGPKATVLAGFVSARTLRFRPLSRVHPVEASRTHVAGGDQ